MAWEVQVGHGEEKFYWEGSTALGQVMQGSGGIYILGGFQDLARKSHSWPALELVVVLLFEQAVEQGDWQGPFQPFQWLCDN